MVTSVLLLSWLLFRCLFDRDGRVSPVMVIVMYHCGYEMLGVPCMVVVLEKYLREISVVVVVLDYSASLR